MTDGPMTGAHLPVNKKKMTEFMACFEALCLLLLQAPGYKPSLNPLRRRISRAQGL